MNGPTIIELDAAIGFMKSRVESTPMPASREAFKTCLAVLLNERERVAPKPLTLGELRECCEMCTPVWVCRDDKTPMFREQVYCGAVLDTIVSFGAEYGKQDIQAIYGRNLTFAEDDYGKTWLAYRTKPEGSAE